MLDIGWDFHVLPLQADETWPTLFGQRALNASNNVAQDGTEWEGCITMVECYNNMEDPNWDLCKEAAISGSPPWSNYAEALKKLVQNFSDGLEAPLIREQDEFAKIMSENRRLGEEFANAIVDTKIDPYDPLVHVRHALISVNLTAMKLVDGVAKLITKTDIL